MYKIYTKEYCPWCDRAKILLHRLGERWEEIDCTDSDKPRQQLLDDGKVTVPQIFYGEDYVGGFTELFHRIHD